ncbi:MAG: polysaccharide deacetylase family protein [Gemmatales bacterium]|nr:polysaccharide deacetylase family protein [Gemmatales bacterium]MDW8174193.1 polysaccharide deacetylase family protein [Gemmatales bacterium]
MKAARHESHLGDGRVILSFDIEAVHQIEAARHCALSADWRSESYQRVARQVEWLRRVLDRYNVRATFFWVGKVAWRLAYLVRALHREKHEVGCHGWSHRALWDMNPEEFTKDIELNKRILENITGEPVAGFRAPTFSISQEKPWAVQSLYELGFHYDSSIYPIVHDRYGLAAAPRGPFRLVGGTAELLELPPATWQLGPVRLAIGGGGHFRFWPLFICDVGIRQALRDTGYAMLYFHPWEFDTDQPKLPLSLFRRWRTYTGIKYMRGKLQRFLGQYQFVLASQAAKELDRHRASLPVFYLGAAKAEMGKQTQGRLT